jgi:hypothetical protein
MPSLVAQSKTELEARGEYVVLANIASGWFGMYPSTWKTRTEAARADGREGPNLVVYRTNIDQPRDHHVIPYAVVASLVVEETLAPTGKTGSRRWNLALKDHELRVTHRSGKLDVRSYLGAQLLTEASEITLPEEVEPTRSFREGAVTKIQINAYERDREARRRCLSYYGRRCAVCGIGLGEIYGPEAGSIIHVHHLISLSEIKQEYIVDPVKDLRPVCPNCHAVIHSRKPAYTIDEVQQMMRRYSTATQHN